MVKQGDLRSRSESESEQGVLWSSGFGPKPGELPMARVKRGPDGPVEARTRRWCKTVGGAVGSGEMPSEPGDSWFSPKCIEVQPQGSVLEVGLWMG